MNPDNDTGGAPRRKLRDILDGGESDIRKAWDETKAAPDYVPLPAGTYTAHVDTVELFNAKTLTPGVKIAFRVCEGEYTRRMVFHDLWLTVAAMPQTKRDLAKLGIDSPDKLDTLDVPPDRIRCKLRVALRKDDDGTERNRVRGFDVVGIDEPEVDAFAPDVASASAADATSAERAADDADLN